ncbi:MULTISPECIES: DUF6257 family protein [unclassified Streptomyces]|uniref:DUF6257 family protein n=1 Tax=unclassified Streptomyces TaxID=2593676 RepID=UPI00056AAD61|nr:MULTISPECIES: DUF6257 family protein [unclassified Streptomyces]KOU16344.1 hypothetical protein ADK49_18255 [Streptomyces sp. WM6349]KOV42619.1 hypothetical protein ADK98_23575 [Streptomyces sp. H036]
MAKDPKFTAREITKIGWYTARMAKRGIAGENVHIGDLTRKVDRIIDGAREREAQQAADAAAAAKAARKAAAKAKNRK